MPSANKPVPGQLIIQEALQVARAYSLTEACHLRWPRRSTIVVCDLIPGLVVANSLPILPIFNPFPKNSLIYRY